jgi:AcrR family transcriptional regulator
MAPEARQERRRELVEAGWRAIRQKGYRDLTIDDVCAEAGLSKGSFYTHFDRKEDLLYALVEDDATGLEELINQLSATDLSGTERIRRFLRALVERGEDPAIVQVRADLWSELPNDAGLRDYFAGKVRERRAMLAGWVDDAVARGEIVDIPANAFAAIILALADGLMVHAFADPGAFRWANVRRAISVLLDALHTHDSA